MPMRSRHGRHTALATCMTPMLQVLIILFGSSSVALSFLFDHSLNLSYAKARARPQ